MSANTAHASHGNPFQPHDFGRDVILAEGRALVALADTIGEEFSRAAGMLFACRGAVVVTGIGKAGLIGQKIVATLASTGTPAHFLHPAEAMHGDLGRVQANDVVLAFSFSGETEEVVRLLAPLRRLGAPLIAVTRNAASQLGQEADLVLALGDLREACPLGLAPSTSTTAMLALGDALALAVSRMRGFQEADFARFHPGGSLGLKLARVEEVMRPLDECRLASDSHSVRNVLIEVRKPGRRTGAMMLVDNQGALVGVFTDSDLARLLEQRRDLQLDRPVRDVMTQKPAMLHPADPLLDAVELLVRRSISELPVVDDHKHPVGMVDITDVLRLLPEPERPPSGDTSDVNTPSDTPPNAAPSSTSDQAITLQFPTVSESS